VGKWADWVVIDKDIFADDSGKSLKHVVVQSTWVNGKKVFTFGESEDEEILSLIEKFGRRYELLRGCGAPYLERLWQCWHDYKDDIDRRWIATWKMKWKYSSFAFEISISSWDSGGAIKVA
jgi:hypothetical protein